MKGLLVDAFTNQLCASCLTHTAHCSIHEFYTGTETSTTREKNIRDFVDNGSGAAGTAIFFILDELDVFIKKGQGVLQYVLKLTRAAYHAGNKASTFAVQ